MIESIHEDASRIAQRTVARKPRSSQTFRPKIDRIVTSRWLGFPIIFIAGSGILADCFRGELPSGLLADLFIGKPVSPLLKQFCSEYGYAGLAVRSPDRWCLPGCSMGGFGHAATNAIFPLFTLLEDFGYLPRVAFNMDSLFRKAGAHGKQALKTLSMGFGCNAAGVIATRVIDSPRSVSLRSSPIIFPLWQLASNPNRYHLHRRPVPLTWQNRLAGAVG